MGRVNKCRLHGTRPFCFLSAPEIRIMNADSSLWVFKLCSNDRIGVYFFMFNVQTFVVLTDVYFTFL